MKKKKNKLTNIPRKETEKLISEGIVTAIEKKAIKGICVVCDDPVVNGELVYAYPVHSECRTALGDKKILERIKELQNG